MSELRQDRITGRWVLVAPGRGRRPGRWKSPQANDGPLPRFDPACPFCPGNETQLPKIIAEASADEAPGWRVRVVPNKFPAVQEEMETDDSLSRRHRALPGDGAHEVLIESPWHDAAPAAMPEADRLAVTSMLLERFKALLGKPEIEAVVAFRNHGPRAGASLTHPHSQLIALRVTPPRLKTFMQEAESYFARHRRCATCDELDIERADGIRTIEENAHFVAAVPFAAEHPFEAWIIPRRHQASFADVSEAELGAFSQVLGSTLLRLRLELNDPPYNFVIDSAPKANPSAPFFHWRMRIVPELVTWGGFELGTDLPINPSRPEEDAAALRSVALE